MEGYIGIISIHNNNGSYCMSQPFLINQIFNSIPGMADTQSCKSPVCSSTLLTKNKYAESRNQPYTICRMQHSSKTSGCRHLIFQYHISKYIISLTDLWQQINMIEYACSRSHSRDSVSASYNNGDAQYTRWNTTLTIPAGRPPGHNEGGCILAIDFIKDHDTNIIRPTVHRCKLCSNSPVMSTILVQ